MISATKHISKYEDSRSVNTTIRISETEYWQSVYEETYDSKIIKTSPIKIVHVDGEDKSSWKSFRVSSVTEEILETIDLINEMFNNASEDIKRVYL